MKLRALVTASLFFAEISSPCFGFEQFSGAGPNSAQAPLPKRGGAFYSNSLIQTISCEPNGEGKQANCMRDCDEEEIRSRETYGKQTADERKAAKAACEKKCGC